MNTTSNKVLRRITGLTCLALLAGTAHAVTVATGDLILGIRADGGQGSGKDLMVNLGPASNFYGAAPNTSFALPALSALDLVSTFGSNWNTRSDMSWGVVGTTGAAAVGIAPARTIWATRAELTVGTTSTPWSRNIALTLQNPSNAIGTMYSGAPGSLDVGVATANSASSAIIDDTLAGSWTPQDDFTPGTSFRYFNPSVRDSLSNIPATAARYDGVNGYDALDLCELRPGTAGSPATLLGAFGLNSSGTLVFSNVPGVFAAVPEPSAALTGLCAALALFIRRRR
jgi:hypothetical protein